MTTDQLTQRAQSLREAFDSTFERPAVGIDAELVDFLIVTAGSDRYALRLSEIASVHTERKVTRVLSPLPELLGLADFRGVLTPVYAVTALLGRPVGEEPRLLVVARHAHPIGFAFTAISRHLRVAPSELTLDDIAGDSFTRGAVAFDGSSLRILQLSMLVDDLARRLESLAPKER